MEDDSKNKNGFIVEMQKAEIAKYSPKERREYEVSVKNYWDYNSTMKTGHQCFQRESKEGKQ